MAQAAYNLAGARRRDAVCHVPVRCLQARVGRLQALGRPAVRTHYQSHHKNELHHNKTQPEISREAKDTVAVILKLAWKTHPFSTNKYSLGQFPGFFRDGWFCVQTVVLQSFRSLPTPAAAGALHTASPCTHQRIS